MQKLRCFLVYLFDNSLYFGHYIGGVAGLLKFRGILSLQNNLVVSCLTSHLAGDPCFFIYCWYLVASLTKVYLDFVCINVKMILTWPKFLVIWRWLALRYAHSISSSYFLLPVLSKLFFQEESQRLDWHLAEFVESSKWTAVHLIIYLVAAG